MVLGLSYDLILLFEPSSELVDLPLCLLFVVLDPVAIFHHRSDLFLASVCDLFGLLLLPAELARSFFELLRLLLKNCQLLPQLPDLLGLGSVLRLVGTELIHIRGSWGIL